jgi:hypothetical protein
MILVRFVGWILLLVGLMVLVRDLLLWIELARWVPMNVADAWRLAANFAPIRPGVVGAAVAEIWICPTLLILGGALLWLGRRRVGYRPL